MACICGRYGGLSLDGDFLCNGSFGSSISGGGIFFGDERDDG